MSHKYIHFAGLLVPPNRHKWSLLTKMDSQCWIIIQAVQKVVRVVRIYLTKNTQTARKTSSNKSAIKNDYVTKTRWEEGSCEFIDIYRPGTESHLSDILLSLSLPNLEGANTYSPAKAFSSSSPSLHKIFLWSCWTYWQSGLFCPLDKSHVRRLLMLTVWQKALWIQAINVSKYGTQADSDVKCDSDQAGV